MTSNFERLLRPEHSGPRAQLVLALAIVETRIAARYEQEQVLAGANRECLGDPARLDAESSCGSLHRRSALFDFDERKVRRILRQPCANGFEAHSPIRC